VKRSAKAASVKA